MKMGLLIEICRILITSKAPCIQNKSTEAGMSCVCLHCLSKAVDIKSILTSTVRWVSEVQRSGQTHYFYSADGASSRIPMFIFSINLFTIVLSTRSSCYANPKVIPPSPPTTALKQITAPNALALRLKSILPILLHLPIHLRLRVPIPKTPQLVASKPAARGLPTLLHSHFSQFLLVYRNKPTASSLPLASWYGATRSRARCASFHRKSSTANALRF
ncbi:hypothetical protein BJ878DRAFT_111661 [Calycina marina]|uniref:Uncharacterized protein n=1 Tax=Calycina marina TaxID=1763456 RepID=A0A9P7Z9A1_9HELO|nr:hypothetical protein BJ878DRAFT_111661 [Calycina marina]